MPLVPMTPVERSHMIDEIRRKGFDPATVRCCIPSAGLPGSEKGIMGCDVADRCPAKLFKAFRNKSWRPQNGAYAVWPDPDLPQKNVIMLPCHEYVRLLQNRQRDGQRDIEEKGKGERIRYVASEGESYQQIVYIKDPANPTGAFIEKVLDLVVPEYKHGSQLAGTASQRDMAALFKDDEDDEPENDPVPAKKRGRPKKDEAGSDWPEAEGKE